MRKIEDPNIGGIVAVQAIEESEAHKYGVPSFKDRNKYIIDTIVEKPTTIPPSLFATYGRYLLDWKIFDYLNLENMYQGELYVAVAIDKLCKVKNVYCKEVAGKWLTTGDPLNYLKAQIEFALKREEYREELKKFLQNVK
jgi:UTP--glucose-1-phosphate uridylyltransferase